MSMDAEALKKLADELEQKNKELLSQIEKYKSDFISMDEHRKVRSEAAENRKKFQEIEPNYNNLLQENEKIKKSMDRIKKETAIMSAAMAFGFNDPADAVRLIGIEAIEIKDDNIDSEVVKGVIEGIVKEKPYLVKAGSSNFGATNPPPPSSSFPHARPEFTNQNAIDKLKLQAMELLKQGRVAESTKLYNKAWEGQFGFKPVSENK